MLLRLYTHPNKKNILLDSVRYQEGKVFGDNKIFFMHHM